MNNLLTPNYPNGRNLFQGKNILVTAAAGSGIGFSTARRFLEEGANVFISDIDKSKLETINDNKITCIDDAFTFDCDLLAPCAVGGIFTKSSIKDLNCKIIAGGANNQLLNSSVADDLHARGIVSVSYTHLTLPTKRIV